MERHPVLARFAVTCCVNTVHCSQGAASITYWVNTGIWSFGIMPSKLVSPKWCLAISVISSSLRPSFHLSGTPLVSGNVFLESEMRLCAISLEVSGSISISTALETPCSSHTPILVNCDGFFKLRPNQQ